MGETSRLHSSVGCFYSHRRSLGFIHWFVIKSSRNDVVLIYLLLRSHKIFYYTGRFDQRCLSCGTISNRVRCYDVGRPCDLDFWVPACWKVGAKIKAYVLTLLPGRFFQVFQVAGGEEEREDVEYTKQTYLHL
jgi:hypothetical protein